MLMGEMCASVGSVFAERLVVCRAMRCKETSKEASNTAIGMKVLFDAKFSPMIASADKVRFVNSFVPPFFLAHPSTSIYLHTSTNIKMQLVLAVIALTCSSFGAAFQPMTGGNRWLLPTPPSSIKLLSASDTKELPSLASQVRSVNYFISRKCNYACKFCFHTAKTSNYLELAQAELGLQMLKDAGTEKINFAGGEPFLHPTLLGELCKKSHEMGLAVSIISNGSRITPEWMKDYGVYVDVLGVSVDSFSPETNALIGRGHVSACCNGLAHVYFIPPYILRYDIE